MLKSWLAPLLEAAEMPLDSVELILVQDPAMNAFVAGGANIFIYTGLIERTKNPGELIGVMAHELGHIAGGHLISGRTALERASYESILGMVLGMGAAILTGNGGAAGAVMQGSSSMAQRHYLMHSRVNESSADQAALRLMDKAGMNPEGLETFFGQLAAQELVSIDQQSEYVRTHPLTLNRIEAVKTNVRASAYYGQPYPAPWVEAHKRMKAKLLGFISPGRVLWEYDDLDHSFSANYARAIAAYRRSRVEEALDLMDGLIKQEPQNPYLYELKGQMLIEFGRVKEGIAPLKKAIELEPDAGLIRIMLGHALVETKQFEAAIKELERALKDEPRSGQARHLLAQAYGRTGDENMAKLNLAEKAVLYGRRTEAGKLAKAVVESAPPDSRPYHLAQDLLIYLDIKP